MNSVKVKKIRMRRALFWALPMIMSALCTGVKADDTEIFTGNGDVSEDVQPNVLFILDNSGSMKAPISDGTRRSRMQAMKDAFNQIITTVDNVNVGVMRFNTPGGSIAYPVTDVDKAIDIPFVNNTRMAESGDDASEMDNGDVSVNSSTLSMGYAEGPAETIEIEIPIQHEDDDGEERLSNGSLTRGHSYFNMDSAQVAALRFYDLGIPAGATIEEAKIRFTSITNYTSDSVIKIEGESTNDPPRFNDNTYYDITRRTRTAASLTWEVTEDWFKKREYYTPDISHILQEQIDHASWESDDAVVFIFDHQSGSMRSGYLYRDDRKNTQGLNGRASVLEVTYSVGSGASGGQNTVGLRFQDVGIPQGATVTSATIGFTAAQTNSSAASFTVAIENSDDAQPFVDTRNNLTDPIHRPKYGSTVNWVVDGAWTADQPEPGPDVTALVQAVVNRSNWCGNNAMAFYVTGTGSENRKIYSFDGGFDQQPTLTVSYEYDADTAPSGSGCINPIFESYLSQTEHDAYQITRSGRTVNNDAASLRIGDSYMSGVRYENMPLKQGAVIRNAYLKVTAHPDDDNDTVPISIYGHDSDNAPAFPESSRNLSNRTLTSASVAWTPGDWVAETVYESPDIKSVIQEIVNRSSWQPGNALALLLKSSSGDKRRIYDWDGGTSKAAQLVIEVESGGIDNSSNSVRQHIAAVVEGLEARTWTPIVDTLYEASLYYRGDPMFYGKYREMFRQQSGVTDERYKRVSVAQSYTGGTHVLPSGCPSTNSSSTACDGEEVTGTPTYITPINSACQSNHIVLLTDGHANNNHQQSRDGINAMVSAWTGQNCENDSNNFNQRCSRDLVRYLANVDQQPSIVGYDNIVNTHTIAFNLDSTSARTYLSDLADVGGGLYKEADTAAELAGAFDEIIRSVLSQNATFVSPGATINQFNRLTHRNEIYFSLFKPNNRAKWHGNLKRYKLLGDPPVISDVNDESAVDLTTGFFKAESQSVWSTDVDGSNVEEGGAAYEIPELEHRKVYTYLSEVEGSSKSLTSATNLFKETNLLLTADRLGVDDETTRNNVLKWARGVDKLDWDQDLDETEVRFQMGDPLHSIPALVTYGGSEESPNIVVFVGTNEGFLHAINTSDGSERFSFIPEELLGNLKTFYDNPIGLSHPYGLDGSPVVWVKDNNHDGEIDAESGDHVYLYIGMRRGGRNYYALDVTNLDAPKILWTIKGGVGDYAKLGQTWSKPVKTRVDIDGTVKDVLIFAGGFDTQQDSVTTITPDTMGNAIFMVDASTGERLWAGYDGATVLIGENFSDMDYSIPGDLAIVDINQDGQAEQFYAADMGGQVWRFDINNGESISGLVDGGVIASIAGETAASTRRFFNKPNVALFSVGGVQKLSISIGSGTRFNPLNRVMEDRFYTLYSSTVYGKPDSYDALDEDDLVDRTNTSEDVDILNGWYIRLPNQGEKVLASSVTVNNTIFFNTYTPDVAANACQAVVGQGRTYAVNLFNANAAFDLDDDGELDPLSDRNRLLHSGAIPPAPKLLISEEGVLTLLVGPEQPYNDQMLGAIRTDRWFNSYWYERSE